MSGQGLGKIIARPLEVSTNPSLRGQRNFLRGNGLKKSGEYPVKASGLHGRSGLPVGTSGFSCETFADGFAI